VLPIIAPVFLDPVHSVLPPSFSYSDRTILLGFVIAAFPIAQFFGAPVLGVFSDKYGRKKVLLVSVFGTAVSLYLFGAGISSRSLFLMFFSRILNGIMGGNVSTAQSAIADMSDMHSKAKNFGLIGLAFGLGFILGPFIGGKLADPHTVSWFNFATPYWFAGTLSLVNVAVIIFWFRETLKNANPGLHISFKTGFRNLGKAFSNPKLRTIFLVAFMAIFGFNCFTQFFQVYLITKFEFNQAQIGMTYAYMGLWIALTQGVVMRVLTRRFTPVRILPFSLLALSLSLVTLLIPERSSQLYFLLPLVSLAQGVSTPNITAIISNSVGMQDQGEILGINGSVQAVAFAIPPVVAGFVTAIDFRLPLTMAALCTFAAWLIYVRLFPGASRKGAITT